MSSIFGRLHCSSIPVQPFFYPLSSDEPKSPLLDSRHVCVLKLWIWTCMQMEVFQGGGRDDKYCDRGGHFGPTWIEASLVPGDFKAS